MSFQKIIAILKYKLLPFQSKRYWEKRYAQNKTSGTGSYGNLAEFKACIINEFLTQKKISNVIEWGCGDGNQLKYMNYKKYIGFDVSKHASLMCTKKFHNDRSKKFFNITEYNNEKADLSLSLDVIFHLVEDNFFNNYMNRLFDSSKKYVIIYSSNSNHQFETKVEHYKNRKFTDWVESNKPSFKLINLIKNKYPYEKNKNSGSVSDFYFYMKK